MDISFIACLRGPFKTKYYQKFLLDTQSLLHLEKASSCAGLKGRADVDVGEVKEQPSISLRDSPDTQGYTKKQSTAAAWRREEKRF